MPPVREDAGMGIAPRTRTLGRLVAAVLGLALLPMVAEAASSRSKNFVVEAPTSATAQQVARYAEHYRKVVAVQWLGRELSDWSEPCRVRVKITPGEAGGVTSFGFAGGRVVDQEMDVEGRLDRIIASALPHEVTHTVFAAYFGGPLPRWADEGASLLSEDRRERVRHEQFAVDLMERRGSWPLPQFFAIEDYPKDLMGFYGQGYSVSRFLIENGGEDARPRFLAFLKDGMTKGWDAATRAHYGFADARELDRAWRSWHAVARTEPAANAPGDALVMRAQSPDDGRPR